MVDCSLFPLEITSIKDVDLYCPVKPTSYGQSDDDTTESLWNLQEMKASESKLGYWGMKLKVILVPWPLLSQSPLPCALVAMSNHEVSSFASSFLPTTML